MVFSGIAPKIYIKNGDTQWATTMRLSLLSLTTSLFLRGKKQEETDENDGMENTLLCRFVLDGVGKKLGESIALEDDVIIIKSGNKYLGVPLKHIQDDGKTLMVKGLVDFGKAEEMGERWRKESFREIDQTGKHEGKKD